MPLLTKAKASYTIIAVFSNHNRLVSMQNKQKTVPGKELKGLAKLLYDKILLLVELLPAGSPLPPVSVLKSDFNVGYNILRRVLTALEEEKRLVVKEKSGIYVCARESHGSNKNGAGAIQSGSIPEILGPEPSISILALKPYKFFWDRLASAYNEKGTLLKVSPVYLDGEDMIKGICDGADSDLVSFSGLNLRVQAAMDENAIDLTPFIKGFSPDLELHDWIWEKSGDGRTTGVRPASIMMLLAYRADLFKPFKEDASMQDIVHAAMSARKACGERKAFIFLGHMAMLYRAGALSEKRGSDGMEFAFSTDKLAECLELLRQVSVTEKLSPSCTESYTIYRGSPFAGAPGLVECRATAEMEEGSYRFAPMPVAPGGLEPIMPAPFVYVDERTAYPEECWDFLRFLLSAEGQRIIAGTNMLTPAAKEMYPAMANAERRRAIKRAMENAKPAYDHSPMLYGARFIVELMTERFLKGEFKVDAKALQAEMESRVGKYLRRKTH